MSQKSRMDKCMQRSTYVSGVPFPTEPLRDYMLKQQMQQQLKTCLPIDGVHLQAHQNLAPLPASYNPQVLQGKPAFYDPVRGVYYNGVGYKQQLLTAVEQAPAQPQYVYQAPKSVAQFGTGYGTMVKLPATALQQPEFQNLKGKPAFYDEARGIWFDGANLFMYQAPASQQAVTAVEVQPMVNPFYVEHPSVYVLGS